MVVHTRPHFEKEAKDNSDMDFSLISKLSWTKHDMLYIIYYVP